MWRASDHHRKLLIHRPGPERIRPLTRPRAAPPRQPICSAQHTASERPRLVGRRSLRGIPQLCSNNLARVAAPAADEPGAPGLRGLHRRLGNGYRIFAMGARRFKPSGSAIACRTAR